MENAANVVISSWEGLVLGKHSMHLSDPFMEGIKTDRLDICCIFIYNHLPSLKDK